MVNKRMMTSLRLVSNFGDGDRGAGEIHARAQFRGDANFARACISLAPQSPSPKLETTRSLIMTAFTGQHPCVCPLAFIPFSRPFST